MNTLFAEMHDIDVYTDTTEIRTYQNDTHRCWVFNGPAGAVSITGTDEWDYPLPDGAITCSDFHWLFASKHTVIHRPAAGGEDCPITGGPCQHSEGAEVEDAFGRWWDSTTAFNDALSDDLAHQYDAQFGGAR